MQQQALPEDAEDLQGFWARVSSAYELAAEAAQSGATTCIVAHAAVHSALICRCLGLAPEDIGKFRMSTAGVTVIEFPFGGSTGVIRCVYRGKHVPCSSIDSSCRNTPMGCALVIELMLKLPSSSGHSFNLATRAPTRFSTGVSGYLVVEQCFGGWNLLKDRRTCAGY